MIEKPTTLTTKLLNRRKLSKIGLGIAVGCALFALFLNFQIQNQVCDELGCLPYDIGVTFSIITGVAAALLAAAGFATTSKSYLNGQKRSIVTVLIGLALIAASSYFIIIVANDVIYEGYDTLLIFGPFMVASGAVLSVGLNISLKALRIKDIKLIVSFVLLFITIALAMYIAFSRLLVF